MKIGKMTQELVNKKYLPKKEDIYGEVDVDIEVPEEGIKVGEYRGRLIIYKVKKNK